MVSHLTTAITLDDWNLARRQYVLLFGCLTHREYRWMLEQPDLIRRYCASRFGKGPLRSKSL
jgi:hypothetical protein